MRRLKFNLRKEEVNMWWRSVSEFTNLTGEFSLKTYQQLAMIVSITDGWQRDQETRLFYSSSNTIRE